jgi:hypothetical protein
MVFSVYGRRSTSPSALRNSCGATRGRGARRADLSLMPRALPCQLQRFRADQSFGK